MIPLPNNNAAWKTTAQAGRGVPARPLDADPDDLGGALAARRELGADAERVLIDGFLERTARAIDARVDERVAQHRAATPWQAPAESDRRRVGPRLALAISSLVLGIPLTGIAAAMHEAAGLVLVMVVWTAIVAINVSFNRSLR